jgi:hypothetical protein
MRFQLVKVRVTTPNKRLRVILCIRDLRMWLRLGCVEMRRRVVQTVHRNAVGTRNQMPVGTSSIRPRRCPTTGSAARFS